MDSLQEIQASLGHVVAMLEWVRATLDQGGACPRFRAWTDGESAIFEAVMQRLNLFLVVFNSYTTDSPDQAKLASAIYWLTVAIMKKYANIDVVIRGY